LAETGFDILSFDIETGTRAPLVQTPSDEGSGSLSADGRWIAYSSDETGRSEVYVKPVAGRGRATRISTNGGEYPAWRRDGREILYIEGRSTLMSVSVAAAAEAAIGRPAPLFQTRFGPSEARPYDVSADGSRVLVSVVEGDVTQAPITVVVNWPARQ
ncbi:MAG: TolB family protein, partial [Vicinamibacterales bacterium]